MPTRRPTKQNQDTRRVVARQARVAALLGQGFTQSEIATICGVSEATICQDNKANLAELRRVGVLDTEALVTRQLGALQADETVLRDDWLAWGSDRLYLALLANMKRQAELMALDRPPRKDTGTTVPALDELLRELDR